jgi:DNA repair protein RadC
VVDDKEKSDVAPNAARQPIKDWPTSERPREKLLQLGPEGLSDGELLAVLLRIGKSGQSAEDMGRQLLSQFNGISGIDRAHTEELLAVPGMGIAKTAQLKAAIEIGKRARMQTAHPKSFNDASDVATYIRPRFEGKRHESFLVILLDGQNRLLGERVIAEGIPTQATVYVRRVISTDYFLALVAFNRVGGVKQRMYYTNLAEIRLPMVNSEVQQQYSIQSKKILSCISQANVTLIERKREIEKMILGTRSVEHI